MQNAKMQKREIDRFINFVIHVFVSAQQARGIELRTMLCTGNPTAQSPLDLKMDIQRYYPHLIYSYC